MPSLQHSNPKKIKHIFHKFCSALSFRVQHSLFTWYLRLFWETIWRAFTCTAFTALIDVSTKPFVKDSNTLDWAAAEVSPALSFDPKAFGPNPKPLASRAKAELPAFPVRWSSGIGTVGWGNVTLATRWDDESADCESILPNKERISINFNAVANK